MEQPLLAAVRLHELHALRRAARELEVAERLRVHREDGAGGAHLGRHVPDRGAVGQRQAGQARAEELHELAHHPALAQHLGHGQHEVGGGRALGQLALEPEAHHLRDQHRHRLTEHRGLRLDAAHPPAEHAEAVDHRGVGVGAHQRVRERLPVAGLDHAREVLQVDLVADAGVGRHDREVLERRLAPAQERVALAVALELELGVALEGEALGEHVHLDRVVDHELHRHERVDALRIAAELVHGVAHGGEVHDRRNAREVLHQHPGRGVGDLTRGLVRGHPGGEVLDVLSAHALPVLAAQEVLQQHLQRVRAAAPRRSVTGARPGGRSRACPSRPSARCGLRSCRCGTRLQPYRRPSARIAFRRCTTWPA